MSKEHPQNMRMRKFITEHSRSLIARWLQSVQAHGQRLTTPDLLEGAVLFISSMDYAIMLHASSSWHSTPAGTLSIHSSLPYRASRRS